MADDVSSSIPAEDVSSWFQSVVEFVKSTSANSLYLQNVPRNVSDLKEMDIRPIIDSLPGSEITQIHFGGTELRTNEMQRLNEVLRETKIEKINMAGCNLQVDDVLSLMAVLRDTRVSELDIAGNPICLSGGQLDEFMSYLANSRIKSLNFSGNRISPFAKVSDFFQRLPDTQVTNLGFSSFFMTYQTSISEDLSMPRMLSRLQHMTELDLSSNNINDFLARAISAVLANSNVEKLNLYGNSVTDSGVDSLIPGLVCSKITHLNLELNCINGENGLGHCLKSTKIRELNLTSNSINNGRMFSGPKFLEGSSVSVLNLSSCCSRRNRSVLPIRELQFSELSCLDLSSNCLNLKQVKDVADVLSHSKLTHIDLSENDLCGGCLNALGVSLKKSKLKCISLRKTLESDTSISTINGVTSFLDEMKESAIVSVDFGCNNLGIDVKIFVPVLPDLQILALGLSSNWIENRIVELAEQLKLSNICALDLTDNDLGDDGVAVLAECLKETQVIILELRTNSVTSNGAKALAMALQKTKLRYLDLEENSVEADGLESLAEYVRSTCITHILADKPHHRKMILIDSILWENRKRIQQFASLLKRTSFFTGDSNIFEFDRNFADIDTAIFIEDCLKLYQMVLEAPFIVGAIEQDKYILDLKNQECFKFKPLDPSSALNIFIERTELIEDCELIYRKVIEYPSSVKSAAAQKRDVSFLSKQILWLVLENFPRKFVDFIGSRVEAEVSEHVSLLRKIEERGLPVLVELLLLNRPLYVIEEIHNILHPYVYTLLFKYKQPICNLEIEPEGVEKIVNYFSNHMDLDGATDVISLLTDKK